jgi:hypothetical protein
MIRGTKAVLTTLIQSGVACVGTVVLTEEVRWGGCVIVLALLPTRLTNLIAKTVKQKIWKERVVTVNTKPKITLRMRTKARTMINTEGGVPHRNRLLLLLLLLPSYL